MRYGFDEIQSRVTACLTIKAAVEDQDLLGLWATGDGLTNATEDKAWEDARVERSYTVDYSFRVVESVQHIRVRRRAHFMTIR